MCSTVISNQFKREMSAQRADRLPFTAAAAAAITASPRVRLLVGEGCCEVNSPRRRRGLGRSSGRGGYRRARAAAFRTAESWRGWVVVFRMRGGENRGDGEWDCGTRGAVEWSLEPTTRPRSTVMRTGPLSRCEWMLHCAGVLFHFHNCNYCRTGGPRRIPWESFFNRHPIRMAFILYNMHRCPPSLLVYI
jgi:hypothetical protein